ncbi:MAG: DNA repair protein RecO [Gammaproteobacteria bacterium]|nr:DNA repair protein RecO [Gammaproteobacteria bacterium]
MSAELTPAFVLHQRPYRETSLLLDVFSEQYGRVSLIAKGVRSKKRSQSGILQLYQPLLLSWIGRGDLQTLTAAEVDKPRYILQANSALCGLYINELMVKLLPLNLPEADIFIAYQSVLLHLQDADNTERQLRLFEKRLLSSLGYGLVLDREVETEQEIDERRRYFYRPDSGLYHWYEGMKELPISGRSLRHLTTECDFDKESLLEIKHLMRSVIHFYLGGKPLQSRALFAQLQQHANE